MIVIKARLFIVIKNITESIMNIVLKGNAIDDITASMEDRTPEAKEHVNSMKREGGGEDEELKQQEDDVEDEAVF